MLRTKIQTLKDNYVVNIEIFQPFLIINIEHRAPMVLA